LFFTFGTAKIKLLFYFSKFIFDSPSLFFLPLFISAFLKIEGANIKTFFLSFQINSEVFFLSFHHPKNAVVFAGANINSLFISAILFQK